MPSVDQLKNRLSALLSKTGVDDLGRENKQIARAGSQTELRLLGTGLRNLLGKRFGEKWDAELDAVFGKTTLSEEVPPAAVPLGDDAQIHSRFGTSETYTAMLKQSPAERLESLRAYLVNAARELLGENSATMEGKIAAAASLNELRGVSRAMTEIARLSHSEATLLRFNQKVGVLFIAVEAINPPPLQGH